MNIAVTGASGFVGRRLVETLSAAGHTVRALSVRQEPPAESIEGTEAVIHLAGEPVSQRWSPEVKRRIRDSRVQGTQNLIRAVSTLSQRPSVLVSASAIGIYGERGDEILTETSSPGSGFLAEVCREWESQADLAKALGMRVVKFRIGIVLGRDGGALTKMLPAFRNFAGGRMGSGKQWMSWIHLHDLADLLRYAVEHPLPGVVNATAPNPVRNTEFTTELAHALSRPALFPVPEFALKLMFGEMAEILLQSQRALPRVALAAGYRFRYPDLGTALRNLLG